MAREFALMQVIETVLERGKRVCVDAGDRDSSSSRAPLESLC